MDLFDTSMKEELGDDYMDLMQIIDDYLERPNRSTVLLTVLNTAQNLIDQVEQQTSEIENATQLVTEHTVAQAETSNSNTASHTVEPETKPTDDDDVVYVSSESVAPPIIDLLTPNYGRRRNRRRLHTEDIITLDDSLPQTKTPKRADLQPTSTLASLPPSPSESSGLKLKCCVCMDDPIKHEPTSTICGHIFCKKCIHRAIKCSKKCPLCNKKINSTSQVHRVYV